MSTPKYGEYFHARTPEESDSFSHDVAPVMRLNRPDHDRDITSLVRSTRRGRVSRGIHPLPESVHSDPNPAAGLDSPAEILCWRPRALYPDHAVHPTGGNEPKLVEVCSKVGDYLAKDTTPTRQRIPARMRRGHVLLQDGTHRYVVLSNNAAAVWRWYARYPQEIVSVVAIYIDPQWDKADLKSIASHADAVPSRTIQKDVSEKRVAITYLDSLCTLDLQELPGSWEVDPRHYSSSTFPMLAAALARLAHQDLLTYIGAPS